MRETLSQPEPGAHPVTPITGDAWFQGVITTRPIDATRAESVGLFSAARAGLPVDFWGSTSTDEELAVLIRGLPVDTLPALRELTYRVLLAEFHAPRAAVPPGDASPITGTQAPWRQAPETQAPETQAPQNQAPATHATAPQGALPLIGTHTPDMQAGPAVATGASSFLIARIDKLMDFGAIDQAAALLDTLELADGALRERRFEIALLLGQEQTACETVLRAGAAFSFEPALIFCQARHGDWAGAEQRLSQARGSNVLGPVYEPLLTRFLDADDALHDALHHSGDSGLEAPAPGRLTPLAWRLMEAIGEPVATHGLPVAFAHADLRGTIGWRAQLEAAERLVRSGALPPNQLLGLYTERSAAASGGIWERVRAVQRLDQAIARGDRDAIGEALLAAWPQIVEGELEVAFADLYGDALLNADLTGAERETAVIVGLLSNDYETVALENPGSTPRARFLNSIARGLPPDPADSGTNALKAAIAEAFSSPPPLPEASRLRLSEGRLGAEVLMTLIRLGGASDPRVLSEGLAVLRAIGLEDVARRAALQSLLLERHG